MNPATPDSTYPSSADDARAGGRSPEQRVTGDAPAAEDAVLLQRAAAGDELALGAFYDQWVQPVYAVIVRVLRNADDAEDVLEETFWQVWQRAATFDPARGTARTWVLTIARSRALDRLRARGRRPEASPIPEFIASEEPDPLENVEAQERRDEVGRALATLPAEQRRALELAYFGGYTQSEIAEQLQQPLGTIKTRMRLAMQKLRALLIAAREES